MVRPAAPGKPNWRRSGAIEAVRLKPFPTTTENNPLALSGERPRLQFDEARGAFVEGVVFD